MDKPAEYSYAPDPNAVVIDIDSDFARQIDGKNQAAVWPVINELMDAIKVLHPRLYSAVMDKLG
ncbi:MAG: hypothetical protein IKP40_10370 [Clostridia bacterium]|nr:hypothetical protein [Clostridia bacterium]